MARKIAAEVVKVSEAKAEAKMVQLQRVVQKAEQALVKIEEKHEQLVQKVRLRRSCGRELVTAGVGSW